jgi:hypothetical protein
MIVLLVVGFVANELIKPVDPRWHEKDGTAPEVGAGADTGEVNR